jgi:hypothetical protein
MFTKHSASGTSSAGGAATLTITAGVPYARVVRIFLDSDDDTSTDYSVVDADGQHIFVKTGVDASTPVAFYLVADEADVKDVNGEAAAANAEGTPPPVAHFPLTATIANGGNAKAHVVGVVVEKSYH